MEHPENKENKFKESFSGYEHDPPDRVWENLKKELQAASEPENDPGQIVGNSPFTRKQWQLIFSGIAIILIGFLAVVYFTSNEHHTVRGHAYAGEIRLYRGTAVLFSVADHTSPLDSVNYYRSAMIDENGYYMFKQVVPGKYLLRIAPVENSGIAKKFLPTWYDHFPEPDESHLIIITTDDFIADVHLVRKGDLGM